MPCVHVPYYTHGVCGCTVGQLQELFAAVNAGDDDSEIRRHKGTQAAAAGSSVGKQFVDLLDIKEFEALLVRLSIRLDATRLARLRCVAATCACCLRVLPACVARGLTVATGGYHRMQRLKKDPSNTTPGDDEVAMAPADALRFVLGRLNTSGGFGKVASRRSGGVAGAFVLKASG